MDLLSSVCCNAGSPVGNCGHVAFAADARALSFAMCVWEGGGLPNSQVNSRFYGLLGSQQDF